MMTLKVAGDWVLYFHHAASGKVAYLAESLNLHRRHVHSVTKVNCHLDELIAVQKLAKWLAPIAPEQFHRKERYIQKLREYFDQVTETVE